MKLPNRIKTLLASIIISTICCICSANEKEFIDARTLQREGKYDEAILAFKACLSQDVAGDDVSPEQMFIYTLWGLYFRYLQEYLKLMIIYLYGIYYRNL